MKKKLNFTFIGAGPTMEKHLLALKAIKKYNIELSGIYSRTYIKAKKLKKKYNILHVYKNITDMFKKTNPDVVLLVVSVENVKKILFKLVKFNCKIFVEKPVGINLIETLKIKNKIKTKINDIYVGLNRLQYSSTINLLRLIKKDNSKRIINIFDQQKFTENIKLSKNLMFTNSIHLFCYCPLLARGNIIKIENILLEKKHIIKKIIYSSGDIIFFHSLWNKPGPWKIEISTNNNYYKLSPLENLFVKKSNKLFFREVKMSNYDKKYKPGFKLQLEKFIEKTLNFDGKYNFDYYYNIVKLINRYYQR